MRNTTTLRWVIPLQLDKQYNWHYLVELKKNLQHIRYKCSLCLKKSNQVDKKYKPIALSLLRTYQQDSLSIE